MREFFRRLRLLIPSFAGRRTRGAWLAVRKFAIALGAVFSFLAVEFLSTLGVSVIVFFCGLFTTLVLGGIAWRPLAVMSLLSGVGVLVAYTIRRVLNEEAWREYNRRLDARCRADNDPYIASLDIRGDSLFDRTNFVGGFREIPHEAVNVLLMLKQTQKRWWRKAFPYTIESIKRQIEELERTNRSGAEKIKGLT